MTYGTSLCLAEEYMILNDHLEDAKSLAELAMETAKHRKEDDNVYAAYAEGVLANVLAQQGDFEEAARHYKSALNLYERHYSSSSGPQVRVAHHTHTCSTPVCPLSLL
jgi:tetratricopeptide (TPR) repeat protein